MPVIRALPWRLLPALGKMWSILLILPHLSMENLLLPIVPPDHFEEHPVDAIVITAPGYTDEIAKIIRERFGDKIEIRAMRSNHLEMV